MSAAPVCECGSTRFTATYQAWVAAQFQIIDGNLVLVDAIEVDGAEMHGDWLTVVQCSDCGTQWRPQDGAWTDADGDFLAEPDDLALLEASHQLDGYAFGSLAAVAQPIRFTPPNAPERTQPC